MIVLYLIVQLLKLCHKYVSARLWSFRFFLGDIFLISVYILIVSLLLTQVNQSLPELIFVDTMWPIRKCHFDLEII